MSATKLSVGTRKSHMALFVVMFSTMCWGLLAPGAFRFLRTDPSSPYALFNDSLLHCTAFSFATLLTSLMFGGSQNRLWIIVGLFAILGIGTECMQAFIPTRTCDAFDLISNFAGLALGYKLSAMHMREQAGNESTGILEAFRS